MLKIGKNKVYEFEYVNLMQDGNSWIKFRES